MDSDAYEALGAFIMAQNPCAAGSEVYFTPGWEAVTPIDDRDRRKKAPLDWPLDLNPPPWEPTATPVTFTSKVHKAMRIEYQFRDKDGKLQTEHIMIGFAGGDS